MSPSPEEIRAARVLLNLHQLELTKAAGVGVMTVKRYEAGETVRERYRDAIVAALVAKGVVFVRRGTEIGEVVLDLGVALRMSRQTAD